MKSGIPVELERKILRSIESSKNKNDQKTSRDDLKKLLNELSFSLKYKLSISLYEPLIQKSHILRHVSQLFIAEILPYLIMENFEENQIIYNYDDIPEKSKLLLIK